MVKDKERVERALKAIVKNADKTKALNYAVEYAKHGLVMLSQGATREDLHTQLLYVVSNITRWRGDEATVVRGTLKEAIEAWR